MLLSRLKGLVLQLDLFQSNEFFRYREQSRYRTFTGGICSAILIVICIVIFSSSVIDTFNKANIAWQYGITQQTDNEFTVTTGTQKQAKFMFAVGVNTIDLNAAPRYFDFTLTQESSVAGVGNSSAFSLQACRREDWEGAGSKILETFDRMNFSRMLCPVAGSTFNITGMSTSQAYKFLRVSIMECDPSSPQAAISPCANTSLLTDFLATNPNFILNFYFVNVLINPSDPSEINFYLEDRNYVPFNFAYGGEVNLYMSHYKINTDEQIMPYEQIRSSEGGVVNYVGQYIPSRKFGSLFGRVNIKKSSLSINIQRNYTKLDATLSYVGGLFGFLIIFFFFMRFYTQYSYEVELADRLYSYDQNDPLRADRFHFPAFLGLLGYQVVSLFGDVPWSTMKKYHECRQQIQKQFDVCFLMRRLIFIERSLRVLFQDHQFRGLHMHDKLTLKQAQQLRSFYLLRGRLSNVQDPDQEERSSDQSGHMNVTEDLMENNEALPREDISGLQIDGRRSNNSKIRPPTDLDVSDKHRSMMNDSEAILRPPTSIRSKQPNNNDPLPPASPSILQNKLRLLHKESQSGNRISRKIYEGFSTDLLKNILLRVEEQQRTDNQENNNIVINEHQEDFEIRISKKRVRGREVASEQEQGEQQEKENELTKVRIAPKEQKDEVESKHQEAVSPVEIEMQAHNNIQVANEFQFIP